MCFFEKLGKLDPHQIVFLVWSGPGQFTGAPGRGGYWHERTVGHLVKEGQAGALLRELETIKSLATRDTNYDGLALAAAKGLGLPTYVSASGGEYAEDQKPLAALAHQVLNDGGSCHSYGGVEVAVEPPREHIERERLRGII